MNKFVLAVCAALLIAVSPAIGASAANSDSLPTGPRSAFLNGLYLLAGSASIVMTDSGTIAGSTAGVDGQIFIMTVINRSTGIDNAAVTSLEVHLWNGAAAVIALPSQALVLMAGVGDCAKRTSEKYDYPNDSGGVDSIVLSHCPSGS